MEKYSDYDSKSRCNKSKDWYLEMSNNINDDNKRFNMTKKTLEAKSNKLNERKKDIGRKNIWYR